MLINRHQGKTTGGLSPKFEIGEIRSSGDFKRRWGKFDLLAIPQSRNARCFAAFACSDRAVQAAQALRFDVFNLELDEGLASSYASGHDEDEFDPQMTHLLLLDRSKEKVIGTYRMQTIEQALSGRGIYAGTEYDVSELEPYFSKTVELGRACIAEGYRSFSALHGLWLGIGAFMNLHGSRWLFGCCSVTTRDPDDGWRTLNTLRQNGHMHPSIYLPALKAVSCGPPSRANNPAIEDALPLPKLFHTYMKLGAKVVSEPAIDRAFGTVDFLVMMDSHEVAMSSLDVVNRS